MQNFQKRFEKVKLKMKNRANGLTAKTLP